MTDFILEITTTGASETVVIPGTGTGYSYDIDWDDGDVDTSQTSNSPSHVYASANTYNVAISGTFPRVYYNNGTYKLQVTGITQWGNENTWSADQTGAFLGCSNLIGSIPSDTSGPFASLTSGYRMFNGTSISGTLPSGMALALLTNGREMFKNTSISGTLPSGVTLALLTNGREMFKSTSISGALPTGVTLALLTNGYQMFNGTSISGTLPSGMTLASLTDGFQMFYNTSISGALPTGMALASLTDGSQMFNGTSISGALPSGVTLPLLTTGYRMFNGTSISGALPSGMTLASLTNGQQMFNGTSISGALPTGMTLASLTNGSQMFSGTQIDRVFYSNLLVQMNTYNPNSSVTFHAGTAKYWSGDAATARAALVSKSWSFTDGGLNSSTTWTSGDYTITGDFVLTPTTDWSRMKGTGTMTFSGTAAQNVDVKGETIEDVALNKSSNTLTLTGDMVTDSLTCTSGTLNVNGQSLETTGNFTVGAGCTVTE